MDRLTRIIGRIRRAIALTIVGIITAALVVELVGRMADYVAGELLELLDPDPPPPAPRPRPGRPDWYAARQLADEAEFYALHPIDLTETTSARPAAATE